MRILLIQPEYVTEGIGFRLAALPEPLHLELLAALVPGHEVRILDMRVEGKPYSVRLERGSGQTGTEARRHEGTKGRSFEGEKEK
ncbi:MAG: hypothetical protein ACM359_07215, partial [Bacillota bacterium]